MSLDVIHPHLNIQEEDGSPSVFPFQLKVTNATLTDNGDGTASLITGGSTVGGWQDDGTVVRLVTTTDEVVIGATTAVGGAKLTIDGDTDQIQTIIQGNSTQTSDILVVEDSGGTDLLSVSNTAVTFNGAYTFPTTDGNSNQILVTDGAGNLTFQDAAVDSSRHLIYGLMGG